MENDYYQTKETVEEYIQLAKDVNGKDLIEKLKRYLKKQSQILEIGSGPGSDWKILSGTYNVTGSDNSKEFLIRLKQNNPSGTFLELEAVSLETKLHFDGIYSNKVLHHLSDEELRDSINRQAAILNSGGIICHSFWKGEGSENFKGMFVNYHNEEELKSYFGTQYKIMLMETYKEFEDGDSILMIAEKRTDI